MNQVGQTPEFNLIKRTVYVLGVIYVVFLLIQSIWQNYSTSRGQRDFENKIKFLNEDNQRLKYLNTYFQSKTFQELEARRLLMMKKPGETVVTVQVPNPSEKPATHQAVTPIEKDEKPTMSNPQGWLNYLLGRA